MPEAIVEFVRELEPELKHLIDRRTQEFTIRASAERNRQWTGRQLVSAHRH